MARKRLKIKQKPTLFIACEGTSSEYQYFESWAQTDQAQMFFERINVYPDENEKNPKTTPYQLYQIAAAELKLGSADIAWIVFDKDNHPRLPETYTDATSSKVKIAFSSRSFEEWVLLHFEKNNAIFNATECKDASDRPINCGSLLVPKCISIPCLTGRIRSKNFIPGYSKKKEFDLYSAINLRTEIAIVNAAWLRFQNAASINLPQPPVHTLNPYTDIDQLILKLHERDDKIEWGNASTNVSLNGWTINACINDENILVRLSHSLPQSVALNAQFPSPSFFTTNDELNNTHCDILDRIYIDSANGSSNNLLCSGDTIEFKLQNKDHLYFLFDHQSSRTRIYISLFD